LSNSRLLSVAAIFSLIASPATVRLSAQTILGVTAQGTAAQPNVEIDNTQSIQFQNDASFPISITFTTSGGIVFSSVTNIAAGQKGGTLTPQQLNVTVNYSITNLNNGQVRGPYGIEVGTGPIAINITNGVPDLDTVSIPTPGQIQFNSDASYSFACSPANLISPDLSSLNPGLNPVQTLSSQSVTCTIGTAADNGRNHNQNHQVNVF